MQAIWHGFGSIEGNKKVLNFTWRPNSSSLLCRGVFNSLLKEKFMTFDISGNKPSGKAVHRNEKNYGRAVCKSLVVACCLSGLDILSIWIFTLLP